MGLLHRARWAGALELWLDDEIETAYGERVLVHLTECPDCVREVEAMALLKRSLARLGA